MCSLTWNILLQLLWITLPIVEVIALAFSSLNQQNKIKMIPFQTHSDSCPSATVVVFSLKSHHVAFTVTVNLGSSTYVTVTPDCINTSSTVMGTYIKTCVNTLPTLVTSDQGEDFAHPCQITHKEEQAAVPNWSKHESRYYMSNAACRALCLLGRSIMCAILF